ncbi:hypothetical protein E2562_015637 [Oryza meyeriana var. granulata]|uniref:Uncharacterized protein n=1 Tax=Oryza meyeriana var. granulata TaxID=110450 RepID=A0A6G1EKF2_9ORYZ|nr:hypothetical protein E2562_015637 [Oryza meyeriana var. granulata]KAF0925227.1 hypothetical protein E2562_015637 [Oryza meyeriana var. granulata]
MADANKRINLAAPLISVRRHGGGAGAEGEVVQSSGRTDGTPGGVPFRWEQRPGHPKSVRTRRATMAVAARNDEPARDAMAVVAVTAPVREEARFSDALSVADSCVTVNCSSATGLSDVVRPSRVETAGARGGGAGGVMMDRFLPAAHAVAVLSPQFTSRKASIAATTAATTARNVHGDGLPPRLLPPPEPSPKSHALCIVPTEKTDDANTAAAAAAAVIDSGEWDAHSTRGFSSRRCGTLLLTRCMKSTLLLLNPAPAMRRRGGGRRRERRIPLLSKIGRSQSAANPLVRSTQDGHHLGHDPSIMQSWEEVYINSLRRSARGGRKGIGALLSPEMDRTMPSVRELYLEQGDGVHPKATHLGFLLVFDRSDECRDIDSHCSPPQSCFPDSDEPKLLPPPHIPRPAPKVFDGGKKPRRDAGGGSGGYGWPLLLEDNAAASHDIVPLLPPLPSPKSPSESWLSRALPSVSNNPPATSFLGIHVQHKKQTPPPWYSSRGLAKIVVDDHTRPRQMRIHDLQKS